MQTVPQMERLLSDATKSIMCCPHCKEIVPCPVVKSEGNKQFIEHKDIQFRERKRACSACLQVFKTTECDYKSLEELILKRDEVQKLLQENNKLKRKVHAAQEQLSIIQNRLSE